jgi:hypothetical protein
MALAAGHAVWISTRNRTGGYHPNVSQESEGGERLRTKLPSWSPPQGGYERILTRDRRAARRRPLPGSQITFYRVWLLLVSAFAAAGLTVGPPSLWHGAAIGAAACEAAWLATSLVVPFMRHQLLQIFGLRPAARAER